jgi:ribose transport system permease protein
MSTHTKVATATPAFKINDTPKRHVQLLGSNNFGIIIATVGVLLAASIFANGFLAGSNLLSVVQQIALLGIVATGMTYVIVAGEIDLSVGSQYGFLAIAMAWMVSQMGIPVVAAVPLVIVLGGIIGALNGWFTTRFGLPSFVVTLASLSILRGAALLLSGGVPVKGSVNETFRAIMAGHPLPNLTAQSLWMAGVLLVFGIILATTRFGSNVYSVGGNAKAAADAGIRVARVKIVCFALTGALCGLAAVILVGWLGNANPLTGTGFELSVIAAVVVGGASLNGGKGNIFGTLLGAIIAGVLSNALVLAGVDGNWQQVATGALILAAILLNTFVNKRSQNINTN